MRLLDLFGSGGDGGDSDTNNNGSISDDVNDNVEIVIYVSLGLSIFSNFIIIITFLMFSNLRKFPFLLIFYMSLSCFIDDVIYLIGELIIISEINKTFCIIHGFFIGYFGVLSCSYGAAIAYAIVLKTTSTSLNFSMDSKEKYFHIFCNLISLICSIIPFFNNNYDVDGNTCWIVDSDPTISFVMQIASYYIVFWIEMICVLYWFIRLVIFYKSHMITEENRAIMGEQYKTAKQLLAYPIIMIILILLKTIYRVDAYFINNQKINIGFSSFVYFFGNSQGTMSFLVFGLTGIIKNRITEKIKSCFQSNHSNTVIEDENLEIERSNNEVLQTKNKDDIWENIDRNKIEEEIKNSLN